MNWLFPALLSLICFGLWGFFTKLAITFVDYKNALFYQALGVALIAIFIFFKMDAKPSFQIQGIGYALLMGIAYSLGCLFYFLAIGQKGKLIPVVTLTALYPIITILLTYLLLKETISWSQGLGILFALLSIYLLST